MKKLNIIIHILSTDIFFLNFIYQPIPILQSILMRTKYKTSIVAVINLIFWKEFRIGYFNTAFSHRPKDR